MLDVRDFSRVCGSPAMSSPAALKLLGAAIRQSAIPPSPFCDAAPARSLADGRDSRQSDLQIGK